jgi:uncharacterized protein with ParB-like and HNH nuclease domain
VKIHQSVKFAGLQKQCVKFWGIQNTRWSIFEYKWTIKQVSELIDDLTLKFLEYHDESHDRQEVANYGHYFLGSIVISDKNGYKLIIDGQQRLTTLTLMLIYLHNMQKERDDKVNAAIPNLAVFLKNEYPLWQRNV